MTIEPTELNNYPQLESKMATLRRTGGTATSQENIICPTNETMDVLIQFLVLLEPHLN